MTDMIQELQPGMNRKQANQSFHRTIRPKFVGTGGIKPKEVKAQATMTKRSAITVKQQFRWHMVVDGVLNMLQRENTGICQRTGKAFGEVMHHFVVGGDETCFQASDIGDGMVIAEHGNKKAEKKCQDSRESVTLYRTGTEAEDGGDDEPAPARTHFNEDD
jgi:hypothetical protein